MCAGSAEPLAHVTALETSQKLPPMAVQGQHLHWWDGEMLNAWDWEHWEPMSAEPCAPGTETGEGKGMTDARTQDGRLCIPCLPKLYPEIKDPSRLLHPLYPWSGRGTKPLGAATCSHILGTGCAEAGPAERE